jgi:hypothetical protein
MFNRSRDVRYKGPFKYYVTRFWLFFTPALSCDIFLFLSLIFKPFLPRTVKFIIPEPNLPVTQKFSL